MANKLFVVFAACLGATAAYWGPDLPKGPFCGNQCCLDRQDGCAYPILDTLCYCDEFCDRGRAHDDCCPDYATACLHKPPPETVRDPCRHNGKVYLPNDQRKDNCNTCTCVVNPETDTSEWECTRELCMMNDDIVHTVNRQNAGWKAYNYPQFQGKKLADGLVYKLGTLKLDPITESMNAMGPPNKNTVYLPSFDAREHWPKYISPVRDQGWCGSDWAVSLADVASDRFAIQSQGAESMLLSPQMLLDCNERDQQACHGGHIDIAWNYARNIGLVDEDCYPYKANRTKCPFRRTSTLRADGCKPPVAERTERYRVGPIGRLNGEKAMMADIMLSGPLQARMTVYQDFFHYREGVYRHSRAGNNQLKGDHSVRIIGWGEDERGQKYWLVANSWGPEWGENGYFRIARGVRESGIEDFVVTVLPEVSEAYQRK